jgi:hypothetical protein
MPNQKRLISFSDPAMKWLTARAKRLGVSIAEVIRRIVDERIERDTEK